VASDFWLDYLLNKKVLYIAFAGFCSLVNLGVQRVVHIVYKGPFDLYLGMGAGTIAGFVLKYILDKVFVFEDSSRDLKQEAGKFSLYSFMAVWTTLIFMGTEVLFEYLWSHPQSRYVGGALGLAIGYTVKYHLDSKYVFNQDSQEVSSRNS